MTDFTVTITDLEQLAGITWAREQYNASLPPPPESLPPDTVAGTRSETPPLTPLQQTTQEMATDQEYVQFIMEQAAISYADQKLRAEHMQNYEDAAQTRTAARNAPVQARTVPRSVPDA